MPGAQGGVEKEVVAAHEAGHAIVASCIAQLLPTLAAPVDRLSIIPRSGGALGFTYVPPKAEDRALMFERCASAQTVQLRAAVAGWHGRACMMQVGRHADGEAATSSWVHTCALGCPCLQ